jgi:hypothetical protein
MGEKVRLLSCPSEKISGADIRIYSEAWRYTGQFTRFNRFKRAFPGLGIATVAFAGYCAYEHFFTPPEHHSTGHGEAT